MNFLRDSGKHLRLLPRIPEGPPLVRERIEVVLTILLDGLIVAVAILVRAFLLWLATALLPTGGQTWAIQGLELVLDFGMLGMALVFTVFDIAKRAKNAVDTFRRTMQPSGG